MSPIPNAQPEALDEVQRAPVGNDQPTPWHGQGEARETVDGAEEEFPEHGG